MRRKKILSALLVGACIMSLTACGGKDEAANTTATADPTETVETGTDETESQAPPTMEELLENPYGVSELKSFDASFKMEFDISMDASADEASDEESTSEEEGEEQEEIEVDAEAEVDEETESEAESSVEASSDVILSADSTSKMTMLLDGDVQASEKAVHFTTDFGWTAFGESISSRSSEYYNTIEDDGSIMTYLLYEGVWYKATEAEGGTSDNFKLADSLSTVKMDNPTMVASGDSEYTITGTLSVYDFISGAGTLGYENFMGADGFSDAVYNVIAKFDVESRAIKSMDLELSEPVSGEGLAFNKLDFHITFKQINGVDVTVPDSVLNSAASLDASLNGVDEVDEELYEEPVNGVGISQMDESNTTSDDFEATAAEITGTGLAGANETYTHALFGKDYVYSSEIQLTLQERYGEDLHFSYSEYMFELLGYTPSNPPAHWNWSKIEEQDKYVLAMVYDMGCMSDDTLTALGVDRTEFDQMLATVRAKDTKTLNACAR